MFAPKLNGKKFELQFSIIDSTGDSIIIEYTEKGRKIQENTINVITNAPPYRFHELNLRNYMQLSKFPKPGITYGKLNVTPIIEGSGLLGVPGDFTSMSRFIRTSVMLHFSSTPSKSEDAVNLAFHILNTVDIPKGKSLSRVITSRFIITTAVPTNSNSNCKDIFPKKQIQFINFLVPINAKTLL